MTIKELEIYEANPKICGSFLIGEMVMGFTLDEDCKAFFSPDIHPTVQEEVEKQVIGELINLKNKEKEIFFEWIGGLSKEGKEKLFNFLAVKELSKKSLPAV